MPPSTASQVATVSMETNRTVETDYSDSEDDLDGFERIENLEVGLATAMKVNEHLNREVERFVRELDKVEQERDAWKLRAQQLAKKLADMKREHLGTVMEEAEILAFAMPEDQDPVPTQDFIWPEGDAMLQAVLKKGRAAGWLINPSEVQRGEILGQGAFGITYRGVWRGADVAVKCVRIGSESELKSFLREVEALADLRHPNIVPFLAASIQSPECCWLLCEFMAGGNLSEWLHPDDGTRPSPQPVMRRLQIALDVAAAMAALEALNPPLLHRDLKPSNVFLDGSGAARLGDFGLARRLLPGGTATLTGETGTYLYMSPEMIRHDVYDIKTDVWSWGVMLAQLATGRLPYDNTFLTPIQVALAVADEKLAPDFPADMPPALAALGAMACSADPEMRPSFASIVEEMRAALPPIKSQLAAGGERGVLGRLLGSGTVPASWSKVFARVTGWS